MSQTQTQTLTQKLFNIQQRIVPLTKDSNNPFFKSKYADLNQCLSLVKEECGKERLVLIQGPDIKDGVRGVRTAVIDVDTTQSVDCFVPYSGNEKNAQEIGAATTYNRRFGIVSLFALEQEDDDGEAAVGRGKEARRDNIASSPASTGRSGGEKTPEAKPPVAPKAAGGGSRKTVNEKISLTSKVIIDSKRDTLENVLNMLTAYGVKTKEELNDEQAKKLLTQLEEKLK